MKQTQEMINAKAEELRLRHLEDGMSISFILIAMAEFMQPKQEESEAGKEERILLEKFQVFLNEAYGVLRIGDSDIADFLESRPPAPVIESPPREKEDEPFHFYEANASTDGKLNRVDIPASVEEKGEGEMEREINAKRQCRNCGRPVKYREQYCSGCFEIAEGFFKEQANRVLDRLCNSPAPPSVKEEDAEGDARRILLKHLPDFKVIMTEIAIRKMIDAMQEYAARDYKSAKGIKLPDMYAIDKWVDERFKTNRSDRKELLEMFVKEIRRLNDPQGETN